MKLGWQPRKWLDKKSKLGFRGYPVGTIAFYGPDDRRASKVAVAVIVARDTEPIALLSRHSGGTRESRLWSSPNLPLSVPGRIQPRAGKLQGRV